ncbi:MAG TPA: hypothetical protein VD794_05400 [Flavisolibacter sp.]|nr:hypothetical protein [Flavisolibacter sp.]
MLYNELPLPFPIYDKIEKQDRFRENVAPLLWYKLITPKDSLLSFQFYVTDLDATINGWSFYEATTDSLFTTVDNLVGNISSKALNGVGRKYFYYEGFSLGNNLGLIVGNFYYFKLTLSNGAEYFSEVFYVCDMLRFQGTNPFIRFEYWNDFDMNPLFYNDITNGSVKYRNLIYLEGHIKESEPAVDVEGEPDGEGEIVPTFMKASIQRTIPVLVPDYLKNALVLMQLHDHVVLTTPNGIGSGEIEQLSTSTNSQVNGGYAEVILTFEEALIVRRGCKDNMQ